MGAYRMGLPICQLSSSPMASDLDSMAATKRVTMAQRSASGTSRHMA